MKRKIIKLAVIGCGYWGPNLVRNFSELENAFVSHVCDLRKERLNHLKNLYPHLKTTTKFEDIIKNPEISAVAIATPLSTHYPMAKGALLAGKHTLVEKPMTENVKQAEELIKIAQKKKKILMVSHTFEYTGAVNQIKKIIKSGQLGKIYYIESMRINLGIFQSDTNVIWDLAPHDLSIIFYLLEMEPTAVSAVGVDHIEKGKANTAYIILRFPSKILAHIHNSWLSPVKFRRTVIAGSKKMVVYDDIDPVEKVKVYDSRVVKKYQKFQGTEFPNRQLIYRTGNVFAPKIDHTEPLRVEANHFIESIVKGTRPRSDGYSGLRVVKTLEVIQQSIERGGQEILI